MTENASGPEPEPTDATQDAAAVADAVNGNSPEAQQTGEIAETPGASAPGNPDEDALTQAIGLPEGWDRGSNATQEDLGEDSSHYVGKHSAAGSATKGSIPWWAAVVAVGVVAAVGLGAWLLFGRGSSNPAPAPTPSATSVAVPSVKGFTIEKATESLQGAGLIVGQVTTQASEEPQGTVLSQNPESGSEVAPGAKVDLVVAGTPQPVVPDIVGKSQADAVNALIAAGLSQGTITEEQSDSPAGTVLSQNPRPGETAEKGAKVDFTVSSGSSPVPNVVGKTEAEATAALSNAGLGVTVQSREVPTGQSGVVLEQSPAAGTNAKVGTLVVITVSVVASPSPAPSPTATPAPSPSGSAAPAPSPSGSAAP